MTQENIFDGYVLKSPRLSPTNSPTTAEPKVGVLRDIKQLPITSSYYDETLRYLDLSALQYNASVLDTPGTSPQEYIIWAANTAQLATVPGYFTEAGMGSIPSGNLEVTNLIGPILLYDGTNRVVVADDSGKALGQITDIVMQRGDTAYDDDGWVDPADPSQGRKGSIPFYHIQVDSADQNPLSGIVTIGEPDLTNLDGGLSVARGDQIATVRYTLSPATFWWTRNDRYEKRFGWNQAHQRWEPYKGTPPVNLGYLLENMTYRMDPVVRNLPINSYLPGTSSRDKYSMIRFGTHPDATSTVPFGNGYTGIRVKSDSEVEEGFDFGTEPTLAGVMGQTNGMLVINPDFVLEHAGKIIWYVYKGFQEEADGNLGQLLGSDLNPLFLCPIPGPTDFPLLSFGNRSYLDVQLFNTDELLQDEGDPVAGQVFVSISTGLLKFSPSDIDSSDPSSIDFDVNYLNEVVMYHGVSLTQRPQPLSAVPLKNINGDDAVIGSDTEFYIPDSNQFLGGGLGISGIVCLPDNTGADPNCLNVINIENDLGYSLPGNTRPGGDTFDWDGTGYPRNIHTGRLRSVSNGISDAFLFVSNQAVRDLVEYKSLESLPKKVNKSTAAVSLEPTSISGAWGSKVTLDSSILKQTGEKVYFMQPTLRPSMYTSESIMFSRVRDVFRFDGTESFYFCIDGDFYTWNSSSLPSQSFYTPKEVADSIQALFGFGDEGQCYELSGRIAIRGFSYVEIGFGPTDNDSPEIDLSGCAALGFNPGWRVDDGQDNWLPDSGISFGLYRNVVNQDKSSSDADFYSNIRVTDQIITDNVNAIPYQFLGQVPLQDIAGIDDGVFFQITNTIVDIDSTTIINRPLRNYSDVVYRFSKQIPQFDWVAENITTHPVVQPVTSINFGQPLIEPESLVNAPGVGGSGLYVSLDGSSNVFQTLDTDYLLNTDSGVATLIQQLGQRVSFGAKGQVISSDEFQDDSVDFEELGVQPGYRLKIASQDSYIVEFVNGDTLTVWPDLPDDSGQLTWEVFVGWGKDVYDPTLVADMVYENFRLLNYEPFIIRLFENVGTFPVDQSVSRLRANMRAALDSSRPISIRFGKEHATSTNVSSLVALQKINLGELDNLSLAVPGLTSDRFSNGEFSIQVGPTKYEHGTNLVGVTTFSTNPFGGVGVEYLTEDSGIYTKGTIKFGSSILADYPGAYVYYVEEFQASLPSLTTEYDPSTGLLNFSPEDITTWSDSPVYFVQQMITEQKKDVAIAPQLGAFSFNQAIPVNSRVEVQYYIADLSGKRVGEPILEFLPVFISDELATRIGNNTYTFNSALRTIDSDILPVVYIGSILMNYNRQDYAIDYPLELNGMGRIVFISQDIPSDKPVRITYAVQESAGGERAYDTSRNPIWRPPFWINANANQFGLRGDRSTEFIPGQLLRVGGDCHYIKGTRYFSPYLEKDSEGNEIAKGDVTAVYIFPNTTLEIGSRSPGNDIINVISHDPVTTIVDPDGDIPVSTNANVGFMMELDASVFPFEPVLSGQNKIIFKGNLTEFAIPGHILELGGEPYTIAQTELTSDGARTVLTMTGLFRNMFIADYNPTIKLSYRPVYPEGTLDFVGKGSVVQEQGFELVRFDGLNPGQTLTYTVDYTVDFLTGQIKLLSRFQEPLQSGEFFTFSFTKQKSLQPYIQDGVTILPRYTAMYLHAITPSTTNGLLKATVTGTFTFRNPDTFYTRAVPMSSYVVEATEEVLAELQSGNPVGGPFLPSGGTENWEQGRLGILAERQKILDKDRVARTFIEFYQGAILPFEQTLETINGEFIGDRDGKFRFYVGHNNLYPTPGYEDLYTGNLLPKDLWSDVYDDYIPQKRIFFQDGDFVAAADKVSLRDGQLWGLPPDPDIITGLINSQRALITNDVDDKVMLRLGQPYRVSFRTPLNGFMSIDIGFPGQFSITGKRNQFSRLFPTKARTFFVTSPGINADLGDSGYPGFYTLSRNIERLNPATGLLEKKLVSTFKTQIGQLSNPVLGDITSVTDYLLAPRKARGRVWGAFPDGIPANVFIESYRLFNGDLNPVAGDPNPVIAYPCIIGCLTQIEDMPIDPETGWPNNAKFLSVTDGSDIPDIQSGDAELAIPGFNQNDPLYLGKPDGTVYPLNVLVRDVEYGCVLSFADLDGNRIQDPNQVTVQVGSSPVPLFAIIEQGDTVFVQAPWTFKLDDPWQTSNDDFLGALATTYEISNPFLDIYRNGFDISVTTNGEMLDITLPGKDDDFPIALKESRGQNPPTPLTTIGGTVDFQGDNQNPLLIPALQGLPQDDSGDYQIPYLKHANTELDQFNKIQIGSSDIMTPNSNGGYIYPNEILDNSGIIDNDSLPAVLQSNVDVFPFLNSGAFGTGDARSFDLMFVEYQGMSPFGDAWAPLGIHSIGAVSRVGSVSYIEPPRFITPVPKVVGNPALRYTLTNYAVCKDWRADFNRDPIYLSGLSGFEIEEVEIAPATFQTTLHLENFVLVMNDGTLADTGNLRDIYDSHADNEILIRFIARKDPDITDGYGPPYPSTTGGQVSFSLKIKQGIVTFIDYMGTETPHVITGIQFGVNPTGPDPRSGQDIVILSGASILDWGTPVDTTAWYIPYTYTGGDTRTVLYRHEFLMSVDTSIGESPNAFIAADRLTFGEGLDLRWGMVRGSEYSETGVAPYLNLQTELMIDGTRVGFDAGSSYWSKINSYANGSSPFTFHTLGVYGTGSEPYYWTIKVPAYEGWDNAPIATDTDCTFAIAPSSEYNRTGIICQGTGLIASRYETTTDPDVLAEKFNRISEVVSLGGALSSINKNDILVITESNNATYPATTKAGTYLIRYAIEPDFGLPYKEYKINPDSSLGEIGISCGLGSNSGWVPFEFPKIIGSSYSAPTVLLTIDNPVSCEDGYTIGTVKSGFDPTGGQIYIIRVLDGLNQKAPINVPENIKAGGQIMDAAAIAGEPLDVQESYANYVAQWTAYVNNYREAVLYANYSSISESDGELTFVLDTSFYYANGDLCDIADFYNMIQGQSYFVSGMKRLPLNVSGRGMPENNTVGHHDPTGPVPTSYGFSAIRLQSPLPLTAGVEYTDNGVALIAPNFSTIIISAWGTSDAILGNSFVADQLEPHYANVPHTLIMGLVVSVDDWDLLNTPAGGILNAFTDPAFDPDWASPIYATLPLGCLLPNTMAYPNFKAQGGIFLEPTFPRMVQNLYPSDMTNRARLIDDGTSAGDPTGIDDWLREVSLRASNEYAYKASGVDPDYPPDLEATLVEDVKFEVRRIRRWQDVLGFVSDFQSLRYAYEIRRGRISAYGLFPDPNSGIGTDPGSDPLEERAVILPSGMGAFEKTQFAFVQADVDGVVTQLGDFVNPNVNIHPGDTFRVLDDDGFVVATAEIAKVWDYRTLILKPPALAAFTGELGGYHFEIYLKQTPVPHEQSCEQLLDTIIEKEVYRTNCAWSENDVPNEKGGYVKLPEDYSGVSQQTYEFAANKLYDDLNASGGTDTFTALGIRKGDIIIVDPSGEIPPLFSGAFEERGSRPFGDNMTEGRTGYVPGYPDNLDDNRGFYRVTAINDSGEPYLTVNPITEFTGDLSADVVFAQGQSPEREYAVYPTIHNSPLTPDNHEGQMDLRPTAHRNSENGSFSIYPSGQEYLADFSVRPFSYRVVRPSSLFSTEAIDLVLSTRERILSMIELFGASASQKQGNYYVFQDDNQCQDLGSPTNPEDGLGVLSNLYMESIVGNTTTVPFANNSGCLSLLDRRFWVQDPRLDIYTTDSSRPYGMKKSGIGDTPYTAYTDSDNGGDTVLPVYPDLVEEVLNSRDRLRALRYVWLSYRTNTFLGTLAAVEKYDQDVISRLERQYNTLLQRKTIIGLTNE